MDVEIISPGAFSSAQISLDAGEEFVSESGLMVRMSADIDLDVTTKPKGKGGLLSGVKRLLGGDSFFMSTYRADSPGEVVIAPILPGDVHVVQLDGSTTWICAGASYMGSGPDVSLDTQFQGLKGFFSGESLFFMEASGTGPLLVNAFGAIREVEVDGEYVIDTGHVVAYESGLEYSMSKAGSSWLQSFLAGEGFVLNFSGHGRVLIQSHNPTEFGKAIGPKLPERSS
jgi:uncharacterized protein (TIGR00266 family)